MVLINGIEIHKALIIDKPWIDYILELIKTWEMRSRSTKMRGYIGLIEKGSGHIVGIANLTDSLEEMTPDELQANFDKHQVPYGDRPELLKWNKPWVLSDVQRIEPVKYQHKQGAVIWVNV